MGIYKLKLTENSKEYDALLFVNHHEQTLRIIDNEQSKCLLEKIESLSELTSEDLDNLTKEGIPIPKS